LLRIEFTDTAKKQLKKLDTVAGARIVDYLYNRVALVSDPRTLTKPLVGNGFKDLWRFRVGDYRLICDIVDEQLVVVVLATGHQRDVCRES